MLSPLLLQDYYSTIAYNKYPYSVGLMASPVCLASFRFLQDFSLIACARATRFSASARACDVCAGMGDGLPTFRALFLLLDTAWLCPREAERGAGERGAVGLLMVSRDLVGASSGASEVGGEPSRASGTVPVRAVLPFAGGRGNGPLFCLFARLFGLRPRMWFRESNGMLSKALRCVGVAEKGRWEV